MQKNLVLVESPAKAKTIEKYLGEDYKVMATLGHIRDLPKSELGIDIEKDFLPKYLIMKGKTKLIKELKSLIPEKGTVYLAQDLDREGEAIAWHTAQALDLLDENGQEVEKKRGVKVKRIVFNEITKEAIKEAVTNPRDVDIDLVNSQQARRILDRLVGYTLSPLLWKKIRYGLSAGRVQSVALRLIAERERERLAFKPEEYWEIYAFLLDKENQIITCKLLKKNGKKFVPKTQKQAESVKDETKSTKWEVDDVKKEEVRKYPKPPFSTSTLQQIANNKLNFTAKRTMSIAQQLYQGVNLKKSGQTALITYMRTDSFNISTQALSSIRNMIEKDFGKNYLSGKTIFYKNRSKGSQEAHEAIRPTDVSLRPEQIKNDLSKEQFLLYKLIWDRTISCQMSPAVYDRLVIDVKSGEYLFRSSAEISKFDGFTKVWKISKQETEEQLLQSLPNKGDEMNLKDLQLSQHFTKPPARYTDASLVKQLEKYGIGRPSTYAPIISTIQERGYVSKDGRYFFPEDVGLVVNDLLVKHFNEIVDYDFTALMEDKLDEVAAGKIKWVPIIKDFYIPFDAQIKAKDKELKKEEIVVLGKSDEKCPICGKGMLYKLGKYGKFLSCVNFPDCKGMKAPDLPGMEVDFTKYEKPDKCSKCGSEMIIKVGKYGKFWACEKYPNCKETKPLFLKQTCPKCGSKLVERQGKWRATFIGCSNYPKCKYILKAKKTEQNNSEV